MNICPRSTYETRAFDLARSTYECLRVTGIHGCDCAVHRADHKPLSGYPHPPAPAPQSKIDAAPARPLSGRSEARAQWFSAASFGVTRRPLRQQQRIVGHPRRPEDVEHAVGRRDRHGAPAAG
eukprot:1023088-Prymnesium_polylepis.1